MAHEKDLAILGKYDAAKGRACCLKKREQEEGEEDDKWEEEEGKV